MGFGSGIGNVVGQPAAAPAPAQDPTVAAYLKALGFDESAARAQAGQAISNATAQADFQQPEIDYQGQLAQQAVDQDALGRGTWSSGEHEQGLARAQHAQQFNTGRLALNESQTIANAQLSMAQQIAQDEAQRQQYLAKQPTTSGPYFTGW